MKKPPTIRDPYPHFTEAERQEAEDNLDRYLEIVIGIFERLHPDSGSNSRF